jgi:hypothetical protein
MEFFLPSKSFYRKRDGNVIAFMEPTIIIQTGSPKSKPRQRGPHQWE